ncbi:MAG: bifunctional transaldolase/phosoglucose isomerase [Pseudolysinimonas sp.]
MKVSQIQEYGQSVWLDYIRRHLLQDGEFARLVQEEGIRGVTSNPSIFEKAIAGSTDYESAIERYEKSNDETPLAIYESLAVEDIRQAADILLPVYVAFARRDGFVSMEVSPYLAHDTQRTIEEATRLWVTIGRENVMIKVPATPKGIPAIRQLISQGINVNVTLLFSRAVCGQVADAYMDGLEALVARGGDLSRVASVASIFVSRLDVLVDPLLESRARSAPSAEQAELRGLVGKVAIANAKLAYQDWKAMRDSPRWTALAACGAHPQRLLWASTSAKDPRFRDVLYVESLIGPDTVDTIPPTTLDAFRDHGRADSRLEDNIDDARQAMATLARADISIDELTTQLLYDGVKAFSAAFDTLMASVETKRAGVLKSALDRMNYRLPAPLDAEVTEMLVDWRTTGKVRRLWARDASLWTGHDENQWLSWLDVVDAELASIQGLTLFARKARSDFKHAVVLGMGGSSLCPDVLSRTFGPIYGCPELIVLDSTDPAQIRAVEARIDPSRTLFVVSSKSGTTLEPNILKDYFADRVRQAVGESETTKRFVVVTDPGSALQEVAEKEMLARVFFGVPGIGGRYSALSNFGLVPAAIMGIDLERFLHRTAIMAHACASCVPPEQNPGVLLGAILGISARAGRDKVTLVASPGIAQLGAWLEQLLAESTGKEGKGIIPIDREPLGAPSVYGADRIFVYLRLDDAPDAEQDAAVTLIEDAGQPVVRIALGERGDLGQEFFRWAIATAVAGAIIGIDPFNQPDVEASKIAARTLTDAYEKTGALPQESPFYQDGALMLFADEKNHFALDQAAGTDKTLRGYLRAHLERLGRGDYFALLAYVERNDAHDRQLQRIRRAVRDSCHVATCVGFGPRFLHSTGQAYKGGPNSGVFLQLTCDDPNDLQVPGRRFTFGVVKAAQARGDLHVLGQRNRRALRVHLGGDVRRGLAALSKAIERALPTRES